MGLWRDFLAALTGVPVSANGQVADSSLDQRAHQGEPDAAPNAKVAEHSWDQAEPDGMIVCGIIVMVVGLIAVLGAFLFDIGVDTSSLGDLGVNIPSQVANIDKISIREMILQSGGFSFIGGIILFAAGSTRRSVLNAIRSNRQSS